ncbi:alkaline phosphatase family protein [Streptosporangium sp. CA-135522]|uniref:alkaline phosphatase family protein n=1 Tax=Streptosporangium sp. CA-135522 TaxID=3240072 RepID=UPI003D93A139
MRLDRIAAAALAAALITATTAAGPVQAGSLPAVTPVAATAPSVPRYDHVVVVIFENTNYSTIKGSANAPYLNSLAAQGALFTNSFGVTHPSQPNYIALFSGSQQGVSNDSCPKNFTTGNLGQQLLNAGLTFKAYSEGLPSAGYTQCSSGRYVRKHAPWADFPTVGGAAYHVPFSSFPTDYTKLPTVSFVVPDMCSDMHDCSTKTGDTWLKNNLDKYAQWAKTHNSLLIQTFDEDNFTSVNKIFTTFVGQNVKTGYQSANQIDHYTILRTLEDMYGLPALGSAGSKSAVTDVWGSASGVTVSSPGDRVGTVGVAGSLQLSASGGATPYTWSATGLPAGLSLGASTGLISGTPAEAGTSTVTATAGDANGATASATFTWKINPSGTGPVTVFADDFESDRGWSVDPAGTDTATSGAWERGDPEETISTATNRAKQLGATVSGATCLVTGAAAGTSYGANDLDGGTTTVRSTAITLPAGGKTTLAFSYNLANGANSTPDDHLRIKILNGTTTATVFDEQGRNAEVDGTWRQATADLSAHAGETIRLLIEATDAGTASLFETQIDDLTITTTS